jgi:hypothetical protein
VNLNSPLSRRCKRLLVHLSIVVPLLVVAAAPAPPEAINFGNAMLNKVTAATGDPTVGPYPEEGFLPGGRGDLVAYFNDVLAAFASSADVYIPKLNEFDPQRYFNSSSPNRAKDNFVRDFERLKELAGAS